MDTRAPERGPFRFTCTNSDTNSPSREGTAEMNRARRFAVAALAYLALPGCYHYASAIPGVVHQSDPSQYQVVGHFSVDLKRYRGFFGLVHFSSAQVDDAIKREVAAKDGDGVVNVEIREVTTFGESCLSAAMCFGAVVGGVDLLQVSGDVIKFR